MGNISLYCLVDLDAGLKAAVCVGGEGKRLKYCSRLGGGTLELATLLRGADFGEASILAAPSEEAYLC